MQRGVLILIIYAIAITGIAVYLGMRDGDLKINYPEIETPPAIEYRPIFQILQLPASETKVINIYHDSQQAEHQEYADTIQAGDSLGLTGIVEVDVNIDSATAKFSYKDFAIKALEKIVTVTKTERIPEYLETTPAFYSNNWFWIWFLEKLAILGTLAVVIFL